MSDASRLAGATLILDQPKHAPDDPRGRKLRAIGPGLLHLGVKPSSAS